MSTDSLIGALVSNIVQPAIKLMFIVAILVFVWGVVLFIMNPSESEGRKKGLNHILWGIVGLFIMFGVYGIINIIVSSLG